MSAARMGFSIVMGGIYLVFGILQVLGGIIPGFSGELSSLFIPADIIQGFVLCLIGLVFLYGAAEMRAKRPGAEAFLYVGMLLSITFCIITVIDLGAQGVNTVVFGGSSWPLTQFIIPIVYMAIPSFAGFRAWGRKFLSDLTEV